MLAFANQAWGAFAPVAVPVAASAWEILTAWSTLIGSLALVLGGGMAVRQLREAQQSREEEMLLSLAAVFHDTIPVKRRIVAAHLLELLSAGGHASTHAHTDDLADRRRNALADLMRFFETVSTVVAHLRRRDWIRRVRGWRPWRQRSSDNTPAPPSGDEPIDLLEEAMPGHGTHRVIQALAEIYRHAETRGKAALGGTKPTRDRDTDATSRSDSVSLEFGRYAAGYCCALLLLRQPLPDEQVEVEPFFDGWTKARVLDFLQRESIAMTCDELSKR